PWPAQGDDQDGRHQRRAAGGRERAALAPGGEASVRRGTGGPRARRGRGGGGRAARGRDGDRRDADGVLSRAARELQGARAHRVPESRRISAHGDGQGAEAPPARGDRGPMRAVICRAWGEVESLTVEDVAPPTPAPGQVLIDVKASGVNYADAIMVAGR